MSSASADGGSISRSMETSGEGKVAAARTSARLPFDPSYPAHLKVLLGSLARSVGAAQSSVFAEALYQCLDYLIRYWLGANLGALNQLGKSPVKVPEASPPLEEAVRLLRYSVFSWESMPSQPMRQLLRLGFFENTSPPAPRLHTRWMALAGDSLPEGIGAADLANWESKTDLIISRRVVYLQVLSSFLSASRPLFMKYNRTYVLSEEALDLQLHYEGEGTPFSVAPPIPWERYGGRMSLAQIQAVEKSATLPPNPNKPPAPTQVAAPPVEEEKPRTAAVAALVLPAHAPHAWSERVGPLNRLLVAWQAGSISKAGWEEGMGQTASEIVKLLTDLLGVFAATTLSQLRQAGGLLPEPLEAALAAFSEPEQRLKLLHFGWQALAESSPALNTVFLDDNGLPRTFARWLGMPDALLQGLSNLAFWTKVAAHDLDHLDWEEAQRQLGDVYQCLLSAVDAMSGLWGDGSQGGTWQRREDGCLTGKIWLGQSWRTLEEGLPEEAVAELAPREPRPLTEVIQDLQLLQQRGTAPYFIVDEICEFVSTPGSGSGMVIWGPQGAGKSFLLTHLLEEQRQLLTPISPQVNSCDCAWIYSEDSSDFLLESLNEAVGFHRWRGDCDWEPLAPFALADLYRSTARLASLDDPESALPPATEAPLKAYLHSLWSRNQPRSNSQKIAFMLDELRDVEAQPWSSTAMPHQFSWLASTDRELPTGWTSVYPPARLPVPTQDASYKRFLCEHLSGVFGGERESWNAVAARAEVLSEARVLAGLLHRGFVRKADALPAADEAFDYLLGRMRLTAEQTRFLVFVSEAGAVPTSLLTACGFHEEEVAQLIDLFPWLFLLREEGVGRLQEDWEDRLTFLSLAHPSYADKLRNALDAKTVMAAVADHLANALSNHPRWPDGLDFLTFLTWAQRAEHKALGWKLLSMESVRKRREAICARFEGQNRPHRKVIVLGQWIDFLESLELADCPEGLEIVLADVLLEERLWAFSSRALTYRNMGRLREALIDIEKSITEFRQAVATNSSLLNGLAAAHNRRSEILRELGRYNEALRDAHEAVAAYEQVLAQSNRSHLEPLLALALHNRGAVLQELGLLEQAEADMEKALARYRPWQDKLHDRVRLDLARALRERGRLALLREDPVQSRDDSMHVLQLLDRFGDDNAELRVERAQAQHQLAEAYLAIEEETRALEASDRASEIWESLVAEGRLDLRATFAQELNHRASLLIHLGKVDEAAAAAQTAADLHMQLVEDEGRSDLHEHLSRSLLLRGRVWERSGKWESAKDDYSAACRYLSLPSAQGMGLRRQTRDALVETGVYLAGLHFQLGDFEAAVTQTQATLALLEGEVTASVPTMEKKARLLDLLGRSLIHHGDDNDAALQAHDRAVDLLSEMVDVQGHYHLLPRLAESYLGRARTRRQIGQEQTAVEDANMAVELLTFLSEKGGDPGVLAMLGPARLEAAEILWSLGQTERALAHVEDALVDFEIYGEEAQSSQLSSPLLLRGKLLLELGRGEEALDDFEKALVGLRDLQSRGWNVEAQLSELLLLKAEAAMPSQPSIEIVNDVLEAIDEGSSIADSWESLEKLIQQVRARAREELDAGSFEAAAASFTELLEIIKKAEVCASLDELQPYRIRTYQERALVRVQQGSGETAEVRADLSVALQLAARSAAAGGRDDLLLLARVYETRAQSEGSSQAALVDFGRAIEALLEVEPPEPTRLISLYDSRRKLSAEMGDSAGEWRDLCRLRTLLRGSITLGEGNENLRLLISVVMRRTYLLQALDLQQPAQEEGRECLRLLGTLQAQSSGDEQEAVARQTAEFHLHMATPQGDRDWERESFELISHLCEAVEIVYRTSAGWDWIPLEQLQSAFGKAEPITTAKLAHSLLRVFAQKEGSAAWGEILPAVLRHCSWDDLPARLSVDFLETLQSWAGVVTARWIGEALHVLVELPLERLRENAEASEALKGCLEIWSSLPTHQLALMNVPGERLAEQAASLL